MQNANRMTNLLNKIERRLGTKILNLPDELKKEKWAQVIEEDTLDTFSRYFPNMTTIMINHSCPKSTDGYYLIDEYLADNIVMLGVKDINWSLFAQDSTRIQQTAGYGLYDYLANNYGMDDIPLLQGRADMMSAFNNGIYIDFQYPNKLRVTSVTGADVNRMTGKGIPIDIFIKHANNLMTISPTKMETFEDLAQADVAKFLYAGLKYFDGLETVFANIELKLSDLEEEANKRNEVVNYMKENYVSAANDNQPVMYSI